VKQEFEVEVESPPGINRIWFETIPEQKDLIIGNEVKVECKYDRDDLESNPRIQIISPDHFNEGSTIFIKNLSSPTQIECEVSNSAGSARQQLEIFPNQSPKIEKFLPNAQGVLECIVNGFPQPEVSIILPNGTEIDGNKLGNTQFESFSYYICKAKNKWGER